MGGGVERSGEERGVGGRGREEGEGWAWAAPCRCTWRDGMNVLHLSPPLCTRPHDSYTSYEPELLLLQTMLNILSKYFAEVFSQSL